MPNNPIQRKDIIQKDLLKKVIEEFKAWGEVVRLVETDLKNLAKQTKDRIRVIDPNDAKAVTELTKSLTDLTKQQANLVKVKEEEAKTSKELEKLKQEEEKTARERLKTKDLEERAIIRERKEQERLEKLRLRSIKNLSVETNAYKDLARQRTIAQNEFKRLAVQFGEDSEQAQEALEIFNELDESFTSINKSAKDGRPFVGRYADAIKEAGLNAGNSSKILLELRNEQEELNKSLIKQRKEFGKNSDEVKATEKRLESLDDTLKEIEKSSKNTEKGIDNLTSAIKAFATATLLLQALDFIVDIFKSSDSGADGFAKTLNRLVITVQVVVDRIVQSFTTLQANFLNVINGIQIDFLTLIDTFNQPIEIKGFTVFNGAGIDGVTEKLAELRKEQSELSKNTGSLADSFSGLTDEINKKIEASDEAIDQERENIVSLANFRLEATKTEKTIEDLARVYDDDSQSLSDRSEKIQKAIVEQEKLNATNLKIARQEEEVARLRFQASTNNAQAEADFIDAQARRIESEVQGLTELNNKRRESNSINRDIRDLELDVLLDRTDNIKTNNERIISDESTAQARRKQLLQENRNNIEESFKLQAEVVNKELTDLGKATLDFNELISLSSEELAKRLVTDVGETQGIRVLEIIKERTTAIQDLTETQKELNETDREILNTNKDIILQEEALKELRKEGANSEKILANLEEERFQDKKENLEQEIELLKAKNQEEGGASLDLFAKTKELNDLLIQEEERRVAKEKEIKDKEEEEEKERQEKRVEFFKSVNDAITNALEEALNKRFERQQEALDKEIEQSKKQEERLLNLAEQGDKNALESAQKEREAQQEAEREKLRIEQQQLRAQKAIQIYKVLSSNEGDVTKTISDVALLEAFIGSLPAFEKGTEDTGTNGKGVDGKGGSLSILHPNERVVPKHINDKLKGISNDELGNFADVYKSLRPEISSNKKDNNTLGIEKLEKAIKELPKNMPIQELVFDEQEKAYISILKQNGKTNRIHKRSNGLFR